MSEGEPDNQLVRVEHGALALANLADNRILSEMMDVSVVLARESAVASLDLDALVREGKALYCTKGLGMTEENIRAFGLFHRTAEAGHPEGQHYLGYCYQCGNGVPQNFAEAIQWHRKSAEQGNAGAQAELASCYHFGAAQLRIDYSEALKWYRKAAEQGNPSAERGLGWLHYFGLGIPRDIAKGAEWWRKAADKGDAGAQCLLAQCYSRGQGVPKDYVEEVKWMRRAAEQGHRTAQMRLGRCYQNAIGVAQDHVEAVKWFQLAAKQGDSHAQYNLGLCYSFGKGVTRDPKEAVRWYRNAADQGHASAQYTLGRHYFDLAENCCIPEDLLANALSELLLGEKLPQDIKLASNDTIIIPADRAITRTLISKLAERHDRVTLPPNPIGQKIRQIIDDFHKKGESELAEWCESNGGIKYRQAFHWFTKAAEQGHAEAQAFLGICYDSGSGVAMDATEGIRWFRKAAEQGNPIAQSALGSRYQFGTGVPQDYAEALRWFRKSAEQGYAPAQYNLGVCLERGYGAATDIPEAYLWFRLAAEQGHEAADAQKSALELLISSSEHAKADVQYHEIKMKMSQGAAI